MLSPESNEPPPPPPRSSWIWGVLALAAAVIFLYLLFSAPRRPEKVGTVHPSVGTPLTTLDLEPLAQGAAPLTPADLEGRVTLINFWGTWCPPCRIELPHLVELERQLRQREAFRLVSVLCSQDGQDEALQEETARRMLANLKADWPLYLDPRIATREALMQLWRQDYFAYPTTVLVDQQGIIRGVWQGYVPGSELEMREAAEELLERGPSRAGAGVGAASEVFTLLAKEGRAQRGEVSGQLQP